jgi:trehalose 6-phosphate phosphatase
VARPELARPVPGALEVLAALRDRVELVAVVSGRPSAQLARLIPVPGISFVGLYGMNEEEGRDRIEAAAGAIEALAASVSGAWVEDKGVSLTIHYRAAEDPGRAEAVLRPAVRRLAHRYGLTVFEGKMVVEVAAGRVPGKGAVTERLARERGLAGCLYAGDDLPDLEAFSAIEALAAEGVSTVKVAVRTEETPEELLAAADLIVERPAGLLELLDAL